MNKILLSIGLIGLSLTGLSQTAQDILGKYESAIGGKEAIIKVKDFTIYMKGDVQGNELEIISIRKDSRKLLQKVEVSGMGEVSKTVCNGEKVHIESAMMGNQDLEGDFLKITLMQAGLFPELNYNAEEVEISVEGQEDIEGKSNHKLAFKVGDLVWNEYYDLETGLKTQQIIETPQGKSVITYSDYQDKDGIKFPMKLKQDAGMFVIELEVTDIDLNAGIEDSVFEIN